VLLGWERSKNLDIQKVKNFLNYSFS